MQQSGHLHAGSHRSHFIASLHKFLHKTKLFFSHFSRLHGRSQAIQANAHTSHGGDYGNEEPEDIEPTFNPVIEENRLRNEDIDIIPVEEEDLYQYAALMYDAFPNTFWDDIEDIATRPSLVERRRRLAKHFSAINATPGYHLIKAVHSESRNMIGIAAWMENGKYPILRTSYAGIKGIAFANTYVPCPFRDDLVHELEWKKKFGWSNGDVATVYGHHTPAWFEEAAAFDVCRTKALRERPHWFLALICTKRDYRGRGVGTQLMEYGMNRADTAVPALPCVLISVPNALPMYYHLGFEPTGTGVDDTEDKLLIRPPGAGTIGSSE
ncbi:MAG: hypothetical protein Q9162_000837 [Coniocarpon cinnabarinum]